MVLVDDERNHVDVNGAYLTLLGYRRDELLGRPVYSLIVGGPRASEVEWHAAISQGQFTGDTEFRRADGNLVAVQYAATTEVVNRAIPRAVCNPEQLAMGIALPPDGSVRKRIRPAL